MTNTITSTATSFEVRDCALVPISLGIRAQTLRGLADRLGEVPASSVYHHFWGGLLRPNFDDPEYNNDFASWAHYALHDGILAERLAVIDPADYEEIDDLRQELVDVIEARIYETEILLASKPDQKFEFLKSQIMVFDSEQHIRRPEELAEVIPRFTTSSIYYHVIDARRRNPNSRDDFRQWLSGLNGDYESVCRDLAQVDPYFTNLAHLRDELAALFRRHFGGNQ